MIVLIMNNNSNKSLAFFVQEHALYNSAWTNLGNINFVFCLVMDLYYKDRYKAHYLSIGVDRIFQRAGHTVSK